MIDLNCFGRTNTFAYVLWKGFREMSLTITNHRQPKHIQEVWPVTFEVPVSVAYVYKHLLCDANLPTSLTIGFFALTARRNIDQFGGQNNWAVPLKEQCWTEHIQLWNYEVIFNRLYFLCEHQTAIYCTVNNSKSYQK